MLLVFREKNFITRLLHMNSFFKFFWMALAAAGLCIIPSASDEIVFANAHAPGGRVEAPAFGGRILMGSIGEPSNLTPYLATDSASSEITGLLFVAPLKFDKDLNVVPWAAASYETLDNGRRLRFRLRDDLKWQDGTPLTADDVEFTYRVMVDPKTPTAYAEDFMSISRFEKTGPLSFEVFYDKPFARALMTWMGAILPKHILEGQDLMTTSFAPNPVGARPVGLKTLEAGWRFTLDGSVT